MWFYALLLDIVFLVGICIFNHIWSNSVPGFQSVLSYKFYIPAAMRFCFAAAALHAVLVIASLCAERIKLGQQQQCDRKVRTQQSNQDGGGGRGWYRRSMYWWQWAVAFDCVGYAWWQDNGQQAFNGRDNVIILILQLLVFLTNRLPAVKNGFQNGIHHQRPVPIEYK
jgi:hypothetical protein